MTQQPVSGRSPSSDRLSALLAELIEGYAAPIEGETLPDWLEHQNFGESTDPVDVPTDDALRLASLDRTAPAGGAASQWRALLHEARDAASTYHSVTADDGTQMGGGTFGALFDDLEEIRSQHSVALGDLIAGGSLPADDHTKAPLANDDEVGPDGKRYRIGAVVGIGGMGTVYAAEQVRLGRTVAVKMLRQDCSPTQYQRHLALFQLEARITARLDHPSIVPVHDAGDSYLVMKLLRGRTFAQAVSEQRFRDDPAALVEVLVKVSDAVAFAHAHGVIHRDLKGENVIIGDYGEVWLLDWGLAVSTAASDDGTWIAQPLSEVPDGHLCAGTPAFLPPEVARADRAAIGPATDVFLLGALLYLGLSGQSPYRASSPIEAVMAAAEHRVVPLHEVAAKTPHGLLMLVRRAMHRQPDRRGSAAALAADLRRWIARSAAEEASRKAFEEGRNLLRRAVAYSRRDWDKAYPVFTLSIKEFDRAVSLDGDWRQAREARNIAMWLLSRSALRAGDFFLARMIINGHTPPVP